MYGGSRASRQAKARAMDRSMRRERRETAVRKYRAAGENTEKLSPRTRSIARRSIAREKAGAEWQNIPVDPKAGYRRADIDRKIKAKEARQAEKAAAKDAEDKAKDDGGLLGDVAKVLAAADEISKRAPIAGFGDPVTGKPLYSRVKDELNKIEYRPPTGGPLSELPGYSEGIPQTLNRMDGRKPDAPRKLGDDAEFAASFVGGAAGARAGAKGAIAAAKRLRGAKGAAAAKIGTGVKKAAKSKPGQAVAKGGKRVRRKASEATPDAAKPAIRTAGRAAKGTAKHVGRRKLAYAAGPGALGTYAVAKTDDPTELVEAPARAIAGIAKGFNEDKLGTLETTANAVPGIVKAQGELLGNLGLSGLRAAQTAIPGGKQYTAKEIATPTKRMAQEQLKGLKDYAKVYATGSTDEIAKATKDDYGLIPVLSVAPIGAKALARPYKGVRTAARKAVNKERAKGVRKYKVAGERQTKNRAAEEIQPDRPISNRAWKRQQRKRAARQSSRTNVRTRGETIFREADLTRSASKAHFALPREKFTRADTGVEQEIGAADTLGLMLREGIDENNPRAARETLTRIAERANRQSREREASQSPDTPERARVLRADAVTTEVVANYALKHLDDLLANKDFRKTLATYRERVGNPEEYGGLSYSERSRWLPIALNRDDPIKLPEERAEPILRTILKDENATAEDVRADLAIRGKGRGKTAGGSKIKAEMKKRNLAVRRLRAQLDKADPDGPEAAKLNRALLRAESDRAEFRNAIRTTRSKDGYSDTTLQEYLDEVGAVAQAEGRVTPAQTSRQSAVDSAEGPAASATGAQVSPWGRVGGERMEKGSLVRRGDVDESFQSLIEGSIRKPIGRRQLFGMYQNFLDRASLVINRRSEFTGEELSLLINRGVVNLRDYALVPAQLYDRVYKNRTRDTANPEEPDVSAEFGQAYQDTVQGTALREGPTPRPSTERIEGASDFESVQKGLSDALGLRESPGDGRRYRVVPREELAQIMKQGESVSDGWRRAGTVNRVQSKALLATSPAWLAVQFLAESLQGAAAISSTGLATPYSLAKLYAGGNRPSTIGAARNLVRGTDEEAWAFAAVAGETPGVGNPLVGIRTNLREGDIEAADKALRFAKKNRVLESLDRVRTLDTFGDIDRWKASLIRRGVAANYIDKRVNGFTAKLKGALGAQDEIYKALRGKPFDEQLRYFASNKKAVRELHSYMEDVMGEWYALTNLERGPAVLTMFYPYLRMSIRTTLWGFPKRHPVKAAILLTLGAANSEQLRDLLGDDPSMFARYAQAGIYGEDSSTPTSRLDLSRAVPGANAVVEGLMGDEPYMTPLTALQPLIQGGIGIATGKMPFQDDLPEDLGARVGTIAASLLALPQPVRMLDQLDVKSDIPGVKQAADLLNKGEGSGSEINRRLTERDAKSLLVPFAPRSIKSAKAEAKLNDIYDRFTQKSKRSDEAFDKLDRIKASGASEAEKNAARRQVYKEYKRYALAKAELNRIEKSLGLPPSEPLTPSDRDYLKALKGGQEFPLEYSDPVLLAQMKKKEVGPRYYRKRRRQLRLVPKDDWPGGYAPVRRGRLFPSVTSPFESSDGNDRLTPKSGW